MFFWRILTFSCVVTALVSCDRVSQEVKVPSHRKIFLIDSTSLIDKLLWNPYERYAYYPVYYIGEPSDTIILPHHPVSIYYDEERDSKYRSARNWAKLTSKNMSIFVDTSVRRDLKSYFAHYRPEQIVDSICYSAFPVVITNLSDSLLWLGTHDMVYWMVREVKDENGHRVESQKLIKGLCGTNIRKIVIDPKNILVAKLLRCQGTFKTKCRLKYKFGDQVVYSNEFEDWVDKRQLL